jgi:hypothetical protein
MAGRQDAAFGNGKLVPPAAVLTNDLRDTLEHRLYRQITEQILREARVEERVAAALGRIDLPVPEDLQAVVDHALADEPAASWRAAIAQVADRLLAVVRWRIAGDWAMTDQRWDKEAVAMRLEEAANVLARLPEERGYAGSTTCGPSSSEGTAQAPFRQQRRPRRSTAWTRRSAG